MDNGDYIGLSLIGLLFLYFSMSLVCTRLARHKNTKIVEVHSRISKERFLKWAKDIGLLEATDDQIENAASSFAQGGHYYNSWQPKINLQVLIGNNSQLSIFYKINLEDLASVTSSLAHLLPGFRVDLAGQLCDHYSHYPRQLNVILEEMQFRHYEAAQAMAELVRQELQRRQDARQAEKDERFLNPK